MSDEVTVEVTLETYPDKEAAFAERGELPEGLFADHDFVQAQRFVVLPPGTHIECVVHLPDGTTILALAEEG